jgi:hypothetical protein
VLRLARHSSIVPVNASSPISAKPVDLTLRHLYR